MKEYNREILKFEKKYGLKFKEFEKMWDEGKIEDKNSNEIEGDFMDWEMMEMEKNASGTGIGWRIKSRIYY
ncbi:MAG TPA: hypothetical protein VK186_15435 [Candidatus Deferrimicrobium sp.]|nr:hypothetical protein [Candidatus Kapabacteria bacterium]HLP60231.1 hypothetical protein [Candidatus Deferrimicrobium sp.]